MTWIAVQSKICAILLMVPIYAINSFLSLLFPSAALYIDMLRDCYEAYILFVFLSLMLSYLNCDQEYDDSGRNFDFTGNLLPFNLELILVALILTDDLILSLLR